MTEQLAAVYCRRVLLSLPAPASYTACIFSLFSRNTLADFLTMGIVTSLSAIVVEFFTLKSSRSIVYLNFLWVILVFFALMGIYGPVPG